MGSEEPHLNGHAREEALLIRIRRPRAQESSAIWDLLRRSESPDPDARHALPLLVTNFADTCLVAEIEGAVVGFVGAYRSPGPPQSLLVWQIDVDAAFRQQGLGNALLHALLQCPGCADIEYLEASVDPTNLATRRLFEGLARDLETECEVRVPPRPASLSREQDEALLVVGPIRATGASSLERFYETL